MGRKIAGVAIGLVAGMVAMLAIAFLGGLLYPVSGEIDARDPEQVGAAFGSSPAGAKAAIMLSWLGAGFVGAAVARWVARAKGPAWAVAGLFAVYVLLSVLLLPMPAWMQVVAVAGPLVGGLIGSHVGPAPAPQESASDAEI